MSRSTWLGRAGKTTSNAVVGLLLSAIPLTVMASCSDGLAFRSIVLEFAWLDNHYWADPGRRDDFDEVLREFDSLSAATDWGSEPGESRGELMKWREQAGTLVGLMDSELREVLPLLEKMGVTWRTAAPMLDNLAQSLVAKGSAEDVYKTQMIMILFQRIIDDMAAMENSGSRAVTLNTQIEFRLRAVAGVLDELAASLNQTELSSLFTELDPHIRSLLSGTTEFIDLGNALMKWLEIRDDLLFRTMDILELPRSC